MKPAFERMEISTEELEALLERARLEPLREQDYQKLKAAIDTLGYVTELLENRETTLQALRRLLCQASTEKTEKLLREAGIDLSERRKASGERERESAAAGHGRNGAEAYRGAHKVEVSHGSLTHGDRCPECQRGKVYAQRDPGVLVRMRGQAPVQATVYELQKLRCNLCGEVFTAEAPKGVGEEKYDETSAGMIALLKYGSGVPFHRLERLESSLGIPLAASTQWEIVEETAEVIKPALEELIRQAAQGEVLHNDDTSANVLALEREPGDERTGVFTSGIVSVVRSGGGPGQRMALFFTGRQHAGENLADVLKRRAAELGPPVQMSDALSRNTPKLSGPVEILVANCLAHYLDSGVIQGRCVGGPQNAVGWPRAS